MNRFQLFFHHFFRFIWNAIFIVSYPIMATFGILFIGLTYLFSMISRLLAHLSFKDLPKKPIKTDWTLISPEIPLIEGRVYKHIMFGPTCYELRRSDGVPSILEDHIFGHKIQTMKDGVLMEKWNTTEAKDLPDFDICLYYPDNDYLKTLTNIKCFDWHLSDTEENQLLFKWFDGTQGGDLVVTL